MSIHSYLKDGKTFYRTVFRVNGKQKQRRGFTTKAEARKVERELVSASDKGVYITSPRLTLKDYLEHWYVSLEGTSSAGRSQRLRIRQHLNNIIPSLGKIKVRDLKPNHVLSLRKALESKGLAPRTIKYMESALKGALNDGVEQNLLTSNPLQFFKTNPLTLGEEKDVEVFEPNEQRLLLDTARIYAKKHDPRWFMMVFLGLHTGARKGEIFALQWKHIDLDAKLIRIAQSLEFSQGDTKGQLKTTKTKRGNRTIAISNKLVEELKRYQLWVKEYYLSFKKKIMDDDFVLFHDDFGPLHKSALQTRWDTIVRNSGMCKRGFHALRHTHATNMIDANLNIKIIQERLGHSSINITLDIYGHIFKKRGKEKEVQALEIWEANTLGV